MQTLNEAWDGLQKGLVTFVKVENGCFAAVEWKFTYARGWGGRFPRLQSIGKKEYLAQRN